MPLPLRIPSFSFPAPSGPGFACPPGVRSTTARAQAREGIDMKLKISYSGTTRGQKLYTVSDGYDRFFTGTLEEVTRYILLHNHKVMEREEAAQALLRKIRSA